MSEYSKFIDCEYLPPLETQKQETAGRSNPLLKAIQRRKGTRDDQKLQDLDIVLDSLTLDDILKNHDTQS
jgi:hypothetical protein